MARSDEITSGETTFAQDVNAIRKDASAAGQLLAHQMYGALAIGTQPATTKTITITVNSTAVVLTAVSAIGATAGNFLIGATDAATLANLMGLLANPALTTTTQVALSAANQQLLSYLDFALVGTTIYISGLNSLMNQLVTTFACTTTITAASFTASTMQLFVEPGQYYINGTRYIFAGGISPTVTAPVSHPRIDVLTIDSSGTLAWTTGAENASPVTPAYPINKLPICELLNVVSETILNDNANFNASQGWIQNDVRPALVGLPALSAISADLIPDADGTRNLGSLGNEWNNVYAKTAIFVAGVGVAISKFGGTGSDGALTQTSGTTTVAVSGAYYFVKNYTSVSLTSAANITISGVGTNGCIFVMKTQANCTMTTPSGTANVVDMSGQGGQPDGQLGVSTLVPWSTGAGGGGNGTNGTSTQGPASGGVAGNADIATIVNVGRNVPVTCGGAGGRGGFTSFPGTSAGGGGGGGGGVAVLLYNQLTANTGTFTIAGGAGCAGSSSTNAVCPGGAGGGGFYLECGGLLNFTGNISLGGLHGGNGTGGGAGGNGITGGTGTGGGSPSQSNASSSGAGGGAGGWNAANGSGASGTAGGGGASGSYYVGLNGSFA